MKEYEKIIEEIKSNLTDNKEENIKYLNEKSQEYKNHKYSREILKEIGRIIYDNIPDEEKEKMTNLVDKDINSHFDKAMSYIREGNKEKALEELNLFVETSTYMFKDDKVSKYFTPSNAIEFIFIEEDEQSDNVKDTGVQYSMGYCYIGSLYIDKKDFKKAQENFDLAIKWNPYNNTARFEKAEMYKMQNDLKNFYKLTTEAYNYLYEPEDLSRYYRNLGYYYIEKKKYELARALYLYSIQFDPSKKDQAINELAYIDSLFKKELPEMSEVAKIIGKNDIPLFFYGRNVAIIISLYKEAVSQKELDSPLGKYVKSLRDFYINYIGE